VCKFRHFFRTLFSIIFSLDPELDLEGLEMNASSDPKPPGSTYVQSLNGVQGNVAVAITQGSWCAFMYIYKPQQ